MPSDVWATLYNGNHMAVKTYLYIISNFDDELAAAVGVSNAVPSAQRVCQVQCFGFLAELLPARYVHDKRL